MLTRALDRASHLKYLTLLRAQAPSFTAGSSESPDARIPTSANKIPNSPAIRHLESSTEISGNLSSISGIRKVGILLNKSAQADAVGHGRPVEGILVIHGGEDVKYLTIESGLR